MSGIFWRIDRNMAVRPRDAVHNWHVPILFIVPGGHGAGDVAQLEARRFVARMSAACAIVASWMPRSPTHGEAN